MLRKALLAAVSVAALTSAASAADLPSRKAPVYAPVAAAPIFTWTGFYVGVNGGYGWSSDKYGLGVTTVGYLPTKTKADGWFVGGTAGYNWQFANNLVVGVEGDYDWAGLKNSALCNGIAGTACKTKIDALGSLRARLGYAMGNTLVYATGGLGYEHLKASIADPVGGYFGASNKSRWGWTLGAGVEYALTRNWSVKGEYMYYNFGKKNYTFDAAALEIGRAKNDIHTVKLGVNYRFGGYDAPVVAKY